MFELTLPNVLTVVRILLVPVLVAALLSGAAGGDLLAAVVFAVASLTDALDGWIARRRRTESTFGKLMDPLADKLLVVAALVSLVSLNRVAAWVAMVIIAREFAVTGLRQLAMEHGHVMPASAWGKNEAPPSHNCRSRRARYPSSSATISSRPSPSSTFSAMLAISCSAGVPAS